MKQHESYHRPLPLQPGRPPPEQPLWGRFAEDRMAALERDVADLKVERLDLKKKLEA